MDHLPTSSTLYKPTKPNSPKITPKHLFNNTLKRNMTFSKLLLMTLFLYLQTLFTASQILPSSSNSSSSICKTTPDPKFCRSVFPQTSQGDVQDYGRFSLRKSLTQSRKFTRTIDKYLKRNKGLLSQSAVGALQDCRDLAILTTDYLTTSFETVNVTTSSKTLSFSRADDIQTLLSAALTNEQTCLDGVNTAASSSWTIRNGVALPLINDTKLFSVSLALFTKGWVPKKKKQAGYSWAHPRNTHSHNKPLRHFRNGALPLKMTERTRAVYESLSRRKLADDNDDNSVLVSDIVTVNQNGTGNFTTITDAVAAAPNKTDGTAGYFVIYVTSGVYDENVLIAKNKRYLMMIGDGINRTIITGNRSVVDGWTTFNSATFGTSIIDMICFIHINDFSL